MNFALINEATKLAKLIDGHNVAYYARGTPTITDGDYDILVGQLRDLETQLGKPLPGSPTQRVGSDLTGGFTKVKHLAAMLSLENVFSPSEAVAWFGENTADEVVVEAKIDGCAVELRYERGLLVMALTRGDGTVGDDVTANARAIRGIPTKLAKALDLRVRGEIYLRRSQFLELNAAREKAGEEPMANPRNAAAGTLKLKSPAEVAARGLSFIAYTATLPNDYTQQEMTAELLLLGFPTLLAAPLRPFSPDVADIAEQREPETTTPLIFPAQLGDEADLANAIENIRQRRDDLDLEIDGAVIKINSRARQSELGNKTKAPAWACAFKFPPERVATELLDIVITVGRSGQITPNAVLKPVQISGTTVSAASLMNSDELDRLGNPTPGDIVWVEKSAEIIPRIVGIKELRHKSLPWVFPETCECGIALERRGVHWFCNNPACPERIYQKIKHATSKVALDWDGMGEAQVRQIIAVGQELLQRGLRLSDLFNLDPVKVGLKAAAVKKFHVERERVRNAPLWRKLVFLGVEHVGQTLSKELAAKYGSLDAIVEVIVERPDEIRALMGPVALASLTDYLRQEADEIKTLVETAFNFADADRGSLPLAGQVFVITGTLQSGTRDAVVARIEAKGGIVKNSVGKKTTFLIAGEQPGGTKIEDAARCRTAVITEEKLYEILGEAMPTLALPDLDSL